MNNGGGSTLFPLLEPEISRSVFTAIVGLSLLPFLLIGLGFNFGTVEGGLAFEQLILLPEEDLLNNLHLLMIGPQLHTLLEWSAIIAAALTALLAFSHFSMTSNITTPVIGISLLCAGAMDAFHSMVATRLLDTVSDSAVLTPFSWAVARTFNALIVLLGVSTLLIVDTKKSNANPLKFLLAVTGVFVLLGYLTVQWCISTGNVPVTIFPDDIVKRPFDVLPLIIYIFTGAFVFPRFKKRFPSVFSDALIVSTIPAVFVELHMVFGSASLYDSHYFAAHFLKVLAYLVPFVGLVLDYYTTYRKDKFKTEQLHNTYRELEERTLQLTKSNKNLEKTNQYRSDFLASMSHELRTPLNSIIGFGRILSKELSSKSDDRSDRAIQSIFRNSMHLLGLINDILDLSKIDAGRMTLKKETFMVSKLINEITAELSPLAEEKDLEITVVNYARNIEMVSDRTKLKQVLLNLGSNAVKYTDRGSVVISVEREKSGSLGNTVKISFKDTGIGIADSDKDRLFTEFGRADEAQQRAIEGTGLGLMIAEKLSNLLGGYIDFDSEYGVGSEFRVYAPVNNWLSETDDVEEGQWDRKGLSIIYLDSDNEQVTSMEKALKDSAFSFVVEREAGFAVRRCEEVLPDVIVFDYAFPGGADGEILRQLYGRPLLADIPKVVLSTDAGKESKMLADGVDLFIRKPWEKDVLLKQLKGLVCRDFSSALLVGAAPIHKELLQAQFLELNIELYVVETAEQAQKQLHDFLPDFLMINLGNPMVEATRLMVSINNDELCRKLPQVLYNGMTQKRKIIFSNDVQEELALAQPEIDDFFAAIFTLRRRIKTSLMRIETLNRNLSVEKNIAPSEEVAVIAESVPELLSRILVVEDSKDNSELVGWILDEAKIEHDCVFSGREALKQVLQQRYSLILLDINLPDINGREVARRLRATKSYRITPIIAVTAMTSSDSVEEIHSCGIDAVIPKPIVQEKLLSTISRFLKAQKSK